MTSIGNPFAYELHLSHWLCASQKVTKIRRNVRFGRVRLKLHKPSWPTKIWHSPKLLENKLFICNTLVTRKHILKNLKQLRSILNHVTRPSCQLSLWQNVICFWTTGQFNSPVKFYLRIGNSPQQTLQWNLHSQRACLFSECRTCCADSFSGLHKLRRLVIMKCYSCQCLQSLQFQFKI